MKVKDLQKILNDLIENWQWDLDVVQERQLYPDEKWGFRTAQPVIDLTFVAQWFDWTAGKLYLTFEDIRYKPRGTNRRVKKVEEPNT